MTLFTAGLLLGLVGSGHCLAMCGPLVVAIGPRLQPLQGGGPFRRALLYHAGRLSTYMVLALPAGMLGRLLSLQGFGRAAAIVGAVILLLMAFDVRLPWLRRLDRGSASRTARACASAARWRLAHPVAGTFAVGAANGLLPCGMVYAAAAAALASGSLTGASLMMAGFGLGTAPPLIALSTSAASIPLTWRRRLQRATPIVLVVAAAVLLLRGFSTPSAPLSSHQGHHGPPGASASR